MPASTPVQTIPERRSARLGSHILIGFVALQALGLALYAPMYWELGRVGAISVAHLLLIVLASGFLLLGGVLLYLSRSPAPQYFFAFSALFGLVASLQWAQFIVCTGTVLAAAGLVLGFWLPRKADGS